ncbi:MAG TPA: hypothetical protein VKA46_21160 [Gemmataceae bacterium]|nr:hypothetical protein [Gemmataceae bacterium]
MAESAGARGWWGYRVVLYFVVGLVALDAVVAARRPVWRAYDPDDYRMKMHECIQRPYDLVLVGGSPVCEGIDPAVLAGTPWRGRAVENVFNLGLSGATTSEVWHAVRHGIGVPPRLLVYGITASDLNDNRDEPHGPRSLMEVRDVAEWLRLRPQAAQWCLRQYAYGKCDRCWNLYHYRNGIRLWAADRVEQAFPGSFPDAAKEARDGLRYSAALARGDGYAPRPEFQARTLTRMKARNILPSFYFLDNYHLGGHLRYLHKVLDWAEANGVAVVLLDMPVSEDMSQTYREAFAAYAAALAEVERSRGVTVLRPSREALGLSDDDFADLIHLNVNGTARLSAWLRRQLGG